MGFAGVAHALGPIALLLLAACIRSVGADVEEASASPSPAFGTSGSVKVSGFGSHIDETRVDKHGSLYAAHFLASSDSSSSGNGIGRNVIGRVDAVTGQLVAHSTGKAGAVFSGMRRSADGKQ